MEEQVYNKQETNGTAPATRPNSNLIWAILCTFFCCLPLGIVSIVYSTKVDSRWDAGDYAGAYSAAKKAKKWALCGAISSVAVSLISLLVYGVIFFFILKGTTDSYDFDNYFNSDAIEDVIDVEELEEGEIYEDDVFEGYYVDDDEDDYYYDDDEGEYYYDDEDFSVVYDEDGNVYDAPENYD